jgi:putative transcriptional regulator
MAGGTVYRGEEIPVKNKLKILRAERNLSQTALGELVSVSRQTINAIERGKYNPSLPLAFDLADVFNLKIEAIFIREDE